MPTQSSEVSIPSSTLRGVSLSARAAAGLVALLAVLGLSTIWSSVAMLWLLWTTDALKSIGMVVPVVSFLLVLRVWRSLGWEMRGSWWGLPLLAGLAGLVWFRDRAILLMVLGPQWTLVFPPHSLVMFGYGVGVVLLFGGVRLLRASVFPLLLLLLVNPIPHVFNVYVDLPLQRASAHIARAFAQGLGQPLSPDKLRLMFTPEFGMFIAPGCNGIRGAVTMGFIALIAGYLFRFRWRAQVLVVLGAIVLGYLFNFVRLCVLVLFYLLALHFPALQDRAENADYLIGAALFFVAVYLLYVAIGRLSGKHAETAILTLPRVAEPAASLPASFPLRAGALAVLVLIGLASLVHGLRQPGLSAEAKAQQDALGDFPRQAGNYTLVRTWNEDLMAGTLLFHWAEYAPAGGGTHIAVGVSPVLGAHDTMVCHSARGEDPIWHGQASFRSLDDAALGFNAAFFNDGATQYLEATTLCTPGACGEYATPQQHFGFVYSKTTAASFFSLSPGRTMPVMLRAETIDTVLPPEIARRQLTADMASFLGGVNVDGLTSPYRKE